MLEELDGMIEECEDSEVMEHMEYAGAELEDAIAACSDHEEESENVIDVETV